ncbi:MAG: hypothetical protein IPM02_25040 [Betaproteobacteria bacterium]|nr:hypothetical protein [Betaproteobacteria bacterium]
MHSGSALAAMMTAMVSSACRTARWDCRQRSLGSVVSVGSGTASPVLLAEDSVV